MGFNTSYVNVYRYTNTAVHLRLLGFNTSYVNVYLTSYFVHVILIKFQYILC